MPKMFTSGFKPKSTTKKARKIIRSEMNSYYSPKIRPDYSGKSTIENMTTDGNATTGYHKRNNQHITPYHKATALVDGGSFACYYSDQKQMLGKIYGKANVEKWDGNKIHNTYKHLISREYAAMVRKKWERE
ncbi:MAG: hypothetical protein LBN07_04855 [Christensenellaceae bacterium]|jgi:hypothetical protein|nr:hypothetical protein [Christensenellaceae bacterium]